MPQIDASIPLSAKAPDGMSSLGNLLGAARTVQGLQLGNVELQKNEIALKERKGIQELFSNPQVFKGDDGQVDYNRLIEAGMKVAPTTFPTMIPQIITAHKAGIDAQQALSNLSESTRAATGQWLMSQTGKPLDVVAKDAEALKKVNPALAVPLDYAVNYLLKPAAGNQDTLNDAYLKAGQAAMPPGQQAEAMTPGGPAVGNQQQTQVVNTKPLAGQIGAPVAGTTQQQQLPPTTPVFNPETNQPGYLGPQPAGPSPGVPLGAIGPGNQPPTGAGLQTGATPALQVPPATQVARNDYRMQILLGERADRVARGEKPDPELEKAIAALQPKGAARAFVPSGPALGQAENAASTAATAGRDYDATVKSAETASQDIGVLQKIKELAPGAIKGVGSDRRAFISGVAGLLGVSEDQLAKTKTDELIKNSSMLTAQGGGNTDAYRAIIEASRPNNSMTEEAIQNAANQVIAQRKLALVKQQYMTHFKGDHEMYVRELAEFNKIADPRALQYSEMTPDEKSAMKASMSPAMQAEFGQKLRKLQSLGFIK